jgi:hypothetical protein
MIIRSQQGSAKGDELAANLLFISSSIFLPVTVYLQSNLKLIAGATLNG